MKKSFFILGLCFLWIFHLNASAQIVFPKHGDTLNFTQIMFEWKEVKDATFYEITTLNHKRTFLTSKKTTSLATIIQDSFSFGKQYLFFVKAFDKKGNVIYHSDTITFYILINNWCDTAFLKLQSTTFLPKQTASHLVVYDYGVIANKQGKIIWNLPQTDGTFRNLNLNHDGTITYNKNNESVEVDLKGKITWQSPAKLNDTLKVKNYHHDIRKLPNGNFLCLAEQDLAGSNNIYSAVFEITRNNKLVWYWNEQPYYNKRTDGLKSNHVNATFMDISGEHIYLSNRDLNSITKLAIKPQPHVVYHIGSGYKSEGVSNFSQSLFSGQHAVSVTPQNTLLLFNNNTEFKDASSVIEMAMPKPKQTDTAAKLLWQYTFNFNNVKDNFCAKSGDADWLPNGNILVTCGANNRVFEVTKNKKIVWENLTYRKYVSTDEFTPVNTYRSHYCSSLYPCYFTLQKLQSSPNNIQLKINNDGSENDEYLVEFLAKKQVVKTLAIKVKAQQHKIINQKPVTNWGNNIVVRVTSKTNPLQVKRVEIN